MERKATVKLTNKPQSKVTQMFNKNPDKNNTNQTTEETTLKGTSTSKKLTIDDVPKELI